MRANENGFILVTAELSAADAVETSIAVGPEGTIRAEELVSQGDVDLTNFMAAQPSPDGSKCR